MHIHAGLDVGRLLRALSCDDCALLRQFVPWPFLGEPAAFMAGRFVRCEAGWSAELAESDILLRALAPHPKGGGRWVLMNQVVQDILALSRKRLEHGDVVVEERYAPDLPRLRLDVGRMKQVVLNLVTNALHALPQGGTLTVTTERMGDTGVGIPAEDLPRIFEPFFTTKPLGQGTGLGLSISS